jgi:hypothetical protein
MDIVRSEPFLLAFFESVRGWEFGSLGTETFTRTFGESGDTDVSAESASDITESSPEGDFQRRAALLGTETHTLQRTEDPDDDQPRGGMSPWEGSIL